MVSNKEINSQSSSTILRNKQFLMTNSCSTNHNTHWVYLFLLNCITFSFTCSFFPSTTHRRFME